MISCWSPELISPLMMFDLFIFFRPPCAGEAEQEREVSEDKVTYPLDEEGDNLNSYGEKKENICRARRVAGCWDTA